MFQFLSDPCLLGVYLSNFKRFFVDFTDIMVWLKLIKKVPTQINWYCQYGKPRQCVNASDVKWWPIVANNACMPLDGQMTVKFATNAISFLVKTTWSTNASDFEPTKISTKIGNNSQIFFLPFWSAIYLLHLSVGRRMRCFALILVCPEPPTFRPFIPKSLDHRTHSALPYLKKK